MNLANSNNKEIKAIQSFTSLRKIIFSEEGNIESSLVLVPLLTVFLIATQISVAIHARNIAKIHTQDEASKRAISGEFSESDRFMSIYSPDRNQNLDLVISHRRSPIPRILDINRELDAVGIAIVENQR
mgnify:CR=1 FL=1